MYTVPCLYPARTPLRAALRPKKPEASQPIVISDDMFELIMGIFEKATHKRTEFFHHVCYLDLAICDFCLFVFLLESYQSLETGMDFPPFMDYQDVFSAH